VTSTFEDRKTIEARIAATMRDPGAIERSPRSTITPDRSRVDAPGRQAIEMLRGLAGSGAALALGKTIGEGGMGIVRAGEQLSLGREVAIKTLRPDQQGDAAALKLLREAWITGSLEHPNVVPVHDISLDDEGRPRIVLKKIGGAAWSELMHDPRAIAERFSARDPFEWNLRILMQVGNAVHFAHSRGVLHRDLKPENVMVGEFGEVYLLDWGIAVSMREDEEGRLPLARDAHEMAGTPAYMAPEMLGGAPDRLTARTDVYLLGAVLFEVIAGHPPHNGATLMEIVRQVLEPAPPLPADTPNELARIVQRAMDPDPDARFESAEQLRLAVVGFLEHRGSLKLAAEAAARLDEMIAVRASAPPAADPAALRLRIHRLFSESRFGFLQALRIWRDNELARAGLDRAIMTMIELELESGDPKAAGLLLDELPVAPPELASRVDGARRDRDAEQARASRLARDFDPAIGRRTRVFLGMILGAAWTISPWIAHAHELAHPRHDGLAPIGASIAMIALAAGLALWARESLSQTAMNRRLSRAVGVALLGQLAIFGATHALGVSYAHVRPLLLIHYAVVLVMVVAAIEWRFWPSSIVMGIAAAAACVDPGHAYAFLAFANLGLTVNVFVIWGRLDHDVVAPLEERHQKGQEWVRSVLRRRSDAPTDPEKREPR
jgi:hypothetical protein